MGCDVHVHVEYKEKKIIGYDANNNPIYQEGEWKCGDDLVEDIYFGEWKCGDQYGEEGNQEPIKLMPEELRVGRDYQMFAVMANVRNDDENELEIISESRGIPNDVSKEVMEEVVRWSGDAHSHSYLKLNELVQYQKNFQPKKMSGMISLEEMEQFDEFGITPYYIYQDNRYDNFDLVWREWETKCPIDKLVEAIKKQVDKIGVIPLWQWEEDPNGAYNNSSNIRIVFWFDN